MLQHTTYCVQRIIRQPAAFVNSVKAGVIATFKIHLKIKIVIIFNIRLFTDVLLLCKLLLEPMKLRHTTDKRSVMGKHIITSGKTEIAESIKPSKPNFFDKKHKVNPVTNPLEREFIKIIGIKNDDKVQKDKSKVVRIVFKIWFFKTELNVIPPSFIFKQKLFTYSESKSDLSDGTPVEKSAPHNMPAQKHKSKKKYLYEFLFI